MCEYIFVWNTLMPWEHVAGKRYARRIVQISVGCMHPVFANPGDGTKIKPKGFLLILTYGNGRLSRPAVATFKTFLWYAVRTCVTATKTKACLATKSALLMFAPERAELC